MSKQFKEHQAYIQAKMLDFDKCCRDFGFYLTTPLAGSAVRVSPSLFGNAPVVMISRKYIINEPMRILVEDLVKFQQDIETANEEGKINMPVVTFKTSV